MLNNKLFKHYFPAPQVLVEARIPFARTKNFVTKCNRYSCQPQIRGPHAKRSYTETRFHSSFKGLEWRFAVSAITEEATSYITKNHEKWLQRPSALWHSYLAVSDFEIDMSSILQSWSTEKCRIRTCVAKKLKTSQSSMVALRRNQCSTKMKQRELGGKSSRVWKSRSAASQMATSAVTWSFLSWLIHSSWATGIGDPSGRLRGFVSR